MIRRSSTRTPPLVATSVALWLHVLPTLAASAAGAAFDEWDHRGVSAWFTLCQSASLPLWTALSAQLTLMPTAFLGMLAAMSFASASALLPSGHLRRLPTLASHLACLVAMGSCAVLCPRVLAPAATLGGRLFGMTTLELLLSFAVVAALTALLRAPPRPHYC